MIKSTLAALALATAVSFSGTASAAEPTKAEFKRIRSIVEQMQRDNFEMSDRDQYGKSDWAQDIRITGKGDCEDWAIGFRNAILEEMPHLAGSLRMMALWHHNQRNTGDLFVEGVGPEKAHAALFITYKGKEYVANGTKINTTGHGPERRLNRIKLVRATQYSNPKRIVA